MAVQWQNLWAGLNERQQYFLRVMYRRECGLAAYYNSQKTMFDPKKKGAEWRWMCHNGEDGLARDLDVGAEDERALRNNQGSGVTYKALEERALIERRWERALVFSLAHGEQAVSLLDVRLTPKGRRLVKTITEGEAGPGLASEKRRELERKAWDRARFRGHDLGDWQGVDRDADDGQDADDGRGRGRVQALRACRARGRRSATGGTDRRPGGRV